MGAVLHRLTRLPNRILNMLATCGFGSMTDVKAWGSEQASFQKAPQQINVFHEGRPAHQNTNVANNEQKRTSEPHQRFVWQRALN